MTNAMIKGTLALAAGLALAPSALCAQDARLMGTVFDSTRNQPLAGARVVLLGSPLFALTNEDGRFFIPNVPAGVYAVVFRHPRLDSLGITADYVNVRLEPGGATDLLLRIPAQAAGAGSPRPQAQAAQAPPPAASPPPQQQHAARAAAPAVLVGTVTDAGTGRPLTGAVVTINGTSLRIVSDARGRFVLFGVPTGTQALQVEMLGYQERIAPVEPQAGRTLEVTVPISTKPIELPALEVTVRSDLLDRVGYFMRKDEASGRAVFVDRKEIESRGMMTFPDLFARVSAAHIEFYGAGRTALSFKSSSGGWCLPKVYVDGHPIGYHQAGDLDFLTPDHIEAMEVYVGAAAPMPYDDGCGSVLIWQRGAR